MRDTQGKKRNHAEALRKQGIEVVELDVNSDASVDHGVHEVLKRAKRIDVLVNNAGVTFPFLGIYGASKFAPNPHDVADAIAKPVAQPWGQSPRASQTDGCLARRRTELAEGSIGVEAKRVAREETPSAPSASIAFLISGLLCKARLSIPTMSRGESVGTSHTKRLLSPIRKRACLIPWHTWSLGPQTGEPHGGSSVRCCDHLVPWRRVR
jgi:hypothetical protein